MKIKNSLSIGLNERTKEEMAYIEGKYVWRVKLQTT